jgi:uncharacterized hydrophobic protein (TIGR00271 family)
MFTKWYRFLKLALSIRGGTDVEGTIEDVRANVALRGANAWLLVCSALIASVGLDLNSTAVIIGGMLISPLMSPILGVGLGVAILDRSLLKTALGNLALASSISFVTSLLYFLVTPLGQATSEIAARTTPTVLDVGVAFFGGVAGMVAGSRKEKTAAIPGVAIATALMPPLCVAGFGLARTDSSVFLGAFYLYFINAFFIALGTYLVALWLRFPKRERVAADDDARVKWMIVGFSILVMLPSFYIFYGVIQRLRTDRGIRDFISTEVRKDDREPVRWDIEGTPPRETLKIYSVGRKADNDEIARLRNAMSAYGVGELGLRMIQLNLPPEEVERLTERINGDLSSRLKLLSTIDDQREADIESLRRAIEDLRGAADAETAFAADVMRRFASVKTASWNQPATVDERGASDLDKVLTLEFKRGTSPAEIDDVRLRVISAAQAKWPFDRIGVTPQIETNDGESEN